MKLLSLEQSSNFRMMFAQSSTCEGEHLAETTTSKIVLEITVNLSGKLSEYKTLNILQKVEYLKNIYRLFCEEYEAVSHFHTIETCKSGLPHLHGYAELEVPDHVFNNGNELVLKMYLTKMLALLPKQVYKQLSKYNYNHNYRKIQTPAVCIELKEYLSQGWVNYINKNASEKK